MLIFASAEEIVRPTHWMADVAFGGTAILAAIALVIFVLVCVSSTQKLIVGPIYLRRAQSILKWIAVVAPTTMLFGFTIHFLAAYTEMAMRNPVDFESWTALSLDVLGGLVIGLGVSLLCLIGVAIHFFRTSGNNDGGEGS